MNAIGRIVRSDDFERILGTPPRRRTAHFALHYAPGLLPGKLSTPAQPAPVPAVDESLAAAPAAGCWVGLVVPKRHARRAVTRTLLKRQMRSAAARHAQRLGAGCWVLRLKAPFDRSRFTSAASEPLRSLASDELDVLLGRASSPQQASPATAPR